MKYPCTKCGCCCKEIGHVITAQANGLLSNIEKFPYKADAKGVCEMLKGDNTCRVYKHRPQICNIEKMNKVLNMPEDFYFTENAKVCNAMMDKHGIDESFRIKLPINPKTNEKTN